MPPSTLSITSFLILFLSFFTTIDARKFFGFLYVCIGDGCTFGQNAVMVISIVVTVTVILCVCWYKLGCNRNGGEGVEERRTENKDVDNESDCDFTKFKHNQK